MILALLLTLSLQAQAQSASDENPTLTEAGEVTSRACIEGVCPNFVTTTKLTDNNIQDREMARRIMETDLAPPPLEASKSKAER